MGKSSNRVGDMFRKIRRVWREEGFWSICERVLKRLPIPRYRNEMREWFKRFQPDPDTLNYFRTRHWPSSAPKFSILMPVYNVRDDWLREALQSVADQTYPHWELICVNDASTLNHVRATLDEFSLRHANIRAIHCEQNGGVSKASNIALHAANGDYLCFMDHDDFLEPQALHQFATVILDDQPDILYSDEALTDTELDQLLNISARTQFSYDYYLSHPYFIHFVGVRAELVREIGGFDESLSVSHDVDLILRLFEVSSTVSYVPDILYKWRIHDCSLGHTQKTKVRDCTRRAIERHLDRIGVAAEVHNQTTEFNTCDVRFQAPEKPRVAIVIPTKNQAGYLEKCVTSLERTIGSELADIVVIDHESDEPDAKALLEKLRTRHRVIPYSGEFNYARIMNFGVESVRGPYSHYLLLNNDICAIREGWLEHMLGFGQRRDVGAVGAMLLYPDDQIQHAGVTIGLVRLAEHTFKFGDFYSPAGTRIVGHNALLVANRDCTAVTAACMLIRTDVFEKVGGFDETLAVGFNDTDLCLRVRELGYKIIQDAHAVLYHYESQTRRADEELMTHPHDAQVFADRYWPLTFGRDPFYSPLLSFSTTRVDLNPSARFPLRIKGMTAPVIRPNAEVFVAGDGPSASSSETVRKSA